MQALGVPLKELNIFPIGWAVYLFQISLLCVTEWEVCVCVCVLMDESDLLFGPLSQRVCCADNESVLYHANTKWWNANCHSMLRHTPDYTQTDKITPLSLCKGVSSNMAIRKWMKMTVLEVLCLAKYNTSTLYILKLNIFNALHSMFELQLEMKYSVHKWYLYCFFFVSSTHYCFITSFAMH